VVKVVAVWDLLLTAVVLAREKQLAHDELLESDKFVGALSGSTVFEAVELGVTSTLSVVFDASSAVQCFTSHTLYWFVDDTIADHADKVLYNVLMVATTI